MLKQGQGWSQSSVESRFYCRSEGGPPPRGASANLGIRGSGVSSSLSAPFSATVISSFSANEQFAGKKIGSCWCSVSFVVGDEGHGDDMITMMKKIMFVISIL